MNIYQKMSAITSELRTVAKNLTVETGKGSGYKAVSERDIIDAVKPLEEKYGIYSYPCDRKVLESLTLGSESVHNGMLIKKTTFFARIQTTYRFVNIDDPVEFIETVTFAEGIDTQDKGSGKAMTYGDKYALMKAYKISTGEDPDQNASEEERYTVTSRKTSTQSNKRKEPEYKEDEQKKPDSPVHCCEECTQQIVPIVKRDGSPWSVEDIVAYSKGRFGRQLCPDCQKKAFKAEKEQK